MHLKQLEYFVHVAEPRPLSARTRTEVVGLSAYTLEWLALGRIDCAAVYNVAPSAALDLQLVQDEAQAPA